MTRILLVRHALTDTVGKRLTGRSPGIHLNMEGKQQARLLAQRLSGLNIEAVYSSPLERTMETAEAIAKLHNLAVRTSDALLEIDFGEWTNLTTEELRNDPLFNLFNTFRSGTRIPGGELIYEAQLRMITGLGKLCNYKEKTVAVISHADMIRSAIAWYAGIPIDLMSRLEISPASVSIIDVHNYACKLVLMNDTGNLPA